MMTEPKHELMMKLKREVLETKTKEQLINIVLGLSDSLGSYINLLSDWIPFPVPDPKVCGEDAARESIKMVEEVGERYDKIKENN